MSILGKEKLQAFGPFIEFTAVPHNWRKDSCGDYAEYQQQALAGCFFSFADDLLALYCGLTGSYSPFAPHDDRLYNEHEAHQLVSDFGLWICQLRCMPDSRLEPALYAHGFGALYQGQQQHSRQLKADLLETLLFLCARINALSAQGQRLFILSI